MSVRFVTSCAPRAIPRTRDSLFTIALARAFLTSHPCLVFQARPWAARAVRAVRALVSVVYRYLAREKGCMLEATSSRYIALTLSPSHSPSLHLCIVAFSAGGWSSDVVDRIMKGMSDLSVKVDTVQSDLGLSNLS